MGKTKKPTGLSITRDGNKYIFKWKIASDNYSSGQYLQYRTKGKTKWRAWQDVSIGNSVTTKTVTISKNSYYPNNDKYLTAVEFRVKGQRAPYTKDDKTYTPEMSDWSNKSMTINEPHTPSVSGSLGSQWNISTFVTNIVTNDSDSHIFTQYEWQSMMVKESLVTDGSKLHWSTSNSTFSKGTGTSLPFTKTFTEDTTALSQGSRTRWFRIRAKGCGGATEWRYAKHVFAVPFKPKIKKYTVTEKSSNYLVDLTWEATSNVAHPIDETTVEYAIGVPANNMALPASLSWTEALTAKDTKGNDRAVFFTSGKLDDDECLYARIRVTHDTRDNISDVVLIKKGNLADPSGLSFTVSGTTATVTATNNSTASTNKNFLQIIYKDNNNYPKGINIGVIPYGSSSVDVTLPSIASTSGTVSAEINAQGHLIYDDGQLLDLSIRNGHLVASVNGEVVYEVGVKAVVGEYSYETQADSSRRYKISSDMESVNTIWYGGTLPVAPTNVTYEFTDKLTLYWNWSWSGADSAEISWSENPDAWESTDEPETYTINQEVTKWILEGLEAGKVYYIKIRLFDSENGVYTPYSTLVEANLTTPPLKPILSLSDGTITTTGKVTASWNYISGDGTDQVYAEILCNNQIIAHTTNAKYITLYAEEMGWTGGNEYSMTLRVKSESGSFSEYSDPASVNVAVPPQAVIENTSLSLKQITDDVGITRNVLSLKSMPMTVDVSGANDGGKTTLAIERLESYYMDRPDEDTIGGYEGETVYLMTQVGDDQITVELDDLIGALDDGAKYRIVATVENGLGQSDTDTLDFEVHWTHQASAPTGTVVIDGIVAKITPVAPQGAESDDVCDIYRLSKDKPELIYPNAEFSSVIVDPYPAINGGYRLVTRTANGDYITEDNKPAWLDIDSNFNYGKAIIEFGTDRVELFYNVDSNHSWTKDFKETQYLGGSVQGDWNPAVSRTGDISSVVLHDLEEGTREALRRLAVYAGICNVRTLDGSSYHANVDVQETNPHEGYGMKSEYSLTITRVDPQGYDGVSIDAWEA